MLIRSLGHYCWRQGYNAEEMRKHLNEYQRMVAMQAEVQDLTDQSAELTPRLNLLVSCQQPSAEAHIPVEGLTVEMESR